MRVWPILVILVFGVVALSLAVAVVALKRRRKCRQQSFRFDMYDWHPSPSRLLSRKTLTSSSSNLEWHVFDNERHARMVRDVCPEERLVFADRFNVVCTCVTENRDVLTTSIITTAPQPSIPRPDIIVQTMLSLAIQPQLRAQPTIVAFDGCRIAPEKPLHKKCTQEFDENLYGEYKENVKGFARRLFPSVKFCELPVRGCLTTLLRTAMKHVETDTVLVVQQDLPFKRSIPLKTVVKALRTDDIDHVAFRRVNNQMHEDYNAKHCRKPGLKRRKTLRVDGITFSQTSQWSDNNHIATRDHYSKVWDAVKDGDFMEHELLCAPFDDTTWNTFVIGTMDDKRPWIFHTDGRGTKLC